MSQNLPPEITVKPPTPRPIIDKFGGVFLFLSNFDYRHPFTLDGLRWATNEHFFQWNKVHGTDATANRLAEAIRTAPTAKAAKMLGRAIPRNYFDPGWDRGTAEIVMAEGLRAKFTQHPDIAQALVDTMGYDLVEGNYWHDTTWGRCTAAYGCGRKPACGGGRNLLGEMLMRLRREFIGVEVERYYHTHAATKAQAIQAVIDGDS